MQTTNFRYQYHLHRRKIILLILFFVPAFVFSQRNVMENDMKFARKPYHFGIHLSGGFTDFKIKHNELFATSDSVLAIKSKYGVDFGIGALISYHINKYVELRTTPGFLFSNKQLNYTFANASTDKKEIPQVFFELPIEFKIKSQPLKDVKIYLIAGLKYGYDIGGKFKVRRKANMPIQSPHDFAINYGAGLEIHFPLFIFSPEFKVSNSVLNSHKYDNSLPSSRFIKGLYNRSFTFSINFEG
jgi:hypothetical protein